MKTMQWVWLAIVVISILVGAWAYPQLPALVATHYGLNGQPNGYMGSFGGAFVMPFILLVLFAVFYFLPLIDPLKKNYAAFRKEYDTLVAIVLAFFFYVYLLMLANNLGHRLDVLQYLAPAFAVLFYYAGVLTGKAKQNWFIGVKTPWTLASENVWNKTNRICGSLFKAAAVVALLGIFLPGIGLFVFVALIFAIVIFAVVYSYVEYMKETKKGKK